MTRTHTGRVRDRWFPFRVRRRSFSRVICKNLILENPFSTTSMRRLWLDRAFFAVGLWSFAFSSESDENGRSRWTVVGSTTETAAAPNVSRRNKFNSYLNYTLVDWLSNWTCLDCTRSTLRYPSIDFPNRTRNNTVRGRSPRLFSFYCTLGNSSRRRPGPLPSHPRPFFVTYVVQITYISDVVWSVRPHFYRQLRFTLWSVLW